MMMAVATFHMAASLVTIAAIFPPTMITAIAMALANVDANTAGANTDTHALGLCNRSHRTNTHQRRDRDTHDSEFLHRNPSSANCRIATVNRIDGA